MTKMKSNLSDFEKYTSINWDGEGAIAVSADTLRVARDLVAATDDQIGLPDAAPSVTGALGLVWDVSDNYLYISVRNSKTAKFYRRAAHITEDKLIEAYSPDDLVAELTERLLSIRATTVLNNPQVLVAQTVIVVEGPNIALPEAIIPGGPEWATRPNFKEYKAA